MKKVLIIVGVIVALGVAYWLASPLFINKQVSEELPSLPGGQTAQPDQLEEQPAKVEVLKTGTVVGQAGHRGSGTISLIKVGEEYYIRMEENFDIINGPDLFVHLGKNGSYNSDINLGSLKGNVGSQNYLVPDPSALQENNEVWVWCRAFSVPFIKAELK